ncbi:MAG: VanZ family protein [Planctomycetota bacterium]|jgi:VanZ family protein
MKLLRRHKSVLLALGIYWPFLFWLTHIPVPQVARQSGMGDKTMHLMAYFVLTFLIWFAVAPYKKVHWNKAKPWFVAIAVLLYGLMDEYLQSKVGRSGDVQDFIANLFGVVLSLGVLSIFGFWTAILTTSAVFIFVLSVMTRIMTLPEYAFYATAFHFTAYTAFTLIWIQWLERFSRFTPGKAGWLAVALAVPAGLLLAVKVAAPVWDRPFNGFDVGIAVFGICLAILISYLTICFSRKT